MSKNKNKIDILSRNEAKRNIPLIDDLIINEKYTKNVFSISV